jgi:hypothetical protein
MVSIYHDANLSTYRFSQEEGSPYILLPVAFVRTGSQEQGSRPVNCFGDAVCRARSGVLTPI